MRSEEIGQTSRESQEDYRRFFDEAVLAIFRSTPDGKPLAVNPAFARMFGYDSPEDILSVVNDVAKDIFADPNRRAEIARAVAENPERTKFENLYRRKDGSTFLGTLLLHPVKDSQGRLCFFEGMIEDITERKRVEDELRTQKELLQKIFDHIPVMIDLISEENGLLLVNREMEQILGWTFDELKAQNRKIFSFLFPNKDDRLRAAQVINAAPNEWVDLKTRVKTGLIIDTSWNVIRLSDGTRLGFGLDISLRKEAERALKRRMIELEALENISAVVRSGENRAEILPPLLDQVMEVLHAQGVSIAFLNPKSDEVVIDLGRGAWEGSAGLHVLREADLGYKVAQSQHYYLDNNALTNERIDWPGPHWKIPALLCLPLIVDGQSMGLLYLGRKTPFLPADIRLAEAAGDVIASALHRIELYEQAERQLERLTALRTIDESILSTPDLETTLVVLLEKITKLLNVDGTNFLLYHADTQTLTSAADMGLPATPIWDPDQPIIETHAGRVALSRQMDFIPDLNQIDDALTQRIRKVGENYTSYVGVPLLAKGELKGVLQIFSHAPLAATRDWFDLLEVLANQAAIAIDNAQLFDAQQKTNQHLTQAYDDTIDGWSRALDLRDKETEGHSQRVTDLTLELARRMGISGDQVIHLRRGARLHDIGKMGIPDSILLKPGGLSDEEWQIMRMHPNLAVNLLSPIDFLEKALEIPYCHHEKWDGTGYPRGLKGVEIPLSARIFTVVDVWDALTHDRPYREAWSKADALAYIRDQAGKHFDPAIANMFLTLIAEREETGSL